MATCPCRPGVNSSLCAYAGSPSWLDALPGHRGSHGHGRLHGPGRVVGRRALAEAPRPPRRHGADAWALYSAAAPVAKRSRAVAKRPPLARVLLVDDHPLWRETLRGVLHHRRVAEVVGEADDGAEAVALASSLQPEVVVMDIDLP